MYLRQRRLNFLSAADRARMTNAAVTRVKEPIDFAQGLEPVETAAELSMTNETTAQISDDLVIFDSSPRALKLFQAAGFRYCPLSHDHRYRHYSG